MNDELRDYRGMKPVSDECDKHIAFLEQMIRDIIAAHCADRDKRLQEERKK